MQWLWKRHPFICFEDWERVPGGGRHAGNPQVCVCVLTLSLLLSSLCSFFKLAPKSQSCSAGVIVMLCEQLNPREKTALRRSTGQRMLWFKDCGENRSLKFPLSCCLNWGQPQLWGIRQHRGSPLFYEEKGRREAFEARGVQTNLE